MYPTLNEMQNAAEELAATHHGRLTLQSLHIWLANAGLGLDSRGQDAALTLIRGTWGPFGATGREIIREPVARF